MLRTIEDASAIAFNLLTSDDELLLIYDDLRGEFGLSQGATRLRSEERTPWRTLNREISRRMRKRVEE